MKRILLAASIAAICLPDCQAQTQQSVPIAPATSQQKMDQFIDDLMARMTLEE